MYLNLALHSIKKPLSDDSTTADHYLQEVTRFPRAFVCLSLRPVYFD